MYIHDPIISSAISKHDDFKFQPHVFEIFKCPYEHIPYVKSAYTANMTPNPFVANLGRFGILLYLFYILGEYRPS